jgi:glycine amidinotransferase
MIPPLEPAVDAKIELGSPMRTLAGTPRSPEAVEKAAEQLDNFADILRKRGIRVDRPTPLDFSQPAKTPDFEVECMFGCMPPRDVLLTIGNMIVEATMSYRCRWFEYLAYRPLLDRYFEEDPNFRWVAAPKPRLTDATYKPRYGKRAATDEDRLRLVAAKDFITTELEPLFDAAECMRCGKDLFVQHGMTANLKGIDWIRRQFPEHRVHAVNFPGDPYPIHIDATLAPLRPGLAINNPFRALPKEQRKIFEINGWEIVDAAKPAHEEPPPLCYSSVWLSMNCLVIDPKTVCIEASEVHQMEQMDKLGFEVIPVPFRDAYAFGGGLHCSTGDVYREGTCEDYFPKQIPGF